jgi:hypothetical protein
MPSRSAPAAIAARATVMAQRPYPSALTTAMVRERVRARAIAMFLPIASGIVCGVDGRRSTDLGWDMPSVQVTAASLDRA